MLFLSRVCYAFVRVCLYVPWSHLLGKGWPLGSRLWCLAVSLSLSHWYPGSGVVLDCIDSWSFAPLLTFMTKSWVSATYQNFSLSPWNLQGVSPRILKPIVCPFRAKFSTSIQVHKVAMKRNWRLCVYCWSHHHILWQTISCVFHF